MNLTTLILRELRERKSQAFTSFFVVVLGVAAFVAVRNTSCYSEQAVQQELDTLGANILILPRGVTLQDYYAADTHDHVLPEDYVYRLTMSGLKGVNNLSPKLSTTAVVADKNVTLTGILPKSEFESKAVWGAGIFSRATGCCGGLGNVAGLSDGQDAGAPMQDRVVPHLARRDVLLGADIAELTGVSEGGRVELLGRKFRVKGVLPPTGTIDDGRIFAHLHTVQELADKGEVVNAIEVVCCCRDNAEKLVGEVADLLPGAKIVTIRQIVDTQMKVNRTMEGLSLAFLVIIALVGGASIANYMFANVRERHREIGTLMALGASPGLVLWMFLLKAVLFGAFGGLCGYVLGTVLAVCLGPRLAGVVVAPMPVLLFWSLAISMSVTLLGSYLPARRAAHLDPCLTLQEM
ncbi:MAG: ABC transporter permease [Gemmataceae bacterium]